jgi:hypothetical protein
MHHLMMFLFSFSWDWLWSELPTKIIAVSGSLYALIQLLKQKLPGLQGNWAVLLNLVGSFAGIFAVMPKDQFFTVQTMAAVITAFVGAGGIHGIVKTVTGLSSTPAQTTNPAAASSAAKIVSLLLLCGVLGFGMMGCKAASTTLPPGALNTFDADSYQSLMVAQAALNSFKAQSVTLSATSPTFKPVLNQAITDYNVAESAWQAYHAGNGTSAAVTAALATITADILKLNGVLGSPQ